MLSLNFRLTIWTTRVEQCINDQWGTNRHPDASWEWGNILRRYRDPDVFAFAGWVNEHRLAFVGLALTNSVAVELRFLEGDPRANCPLGGSRALIALDVSANYAQAVGRREIWVRPVNQALESLCVGLGFELEAPRGQHRYFRRRV